jgi:phage tail sheath gpL-like
VVMSVNTRSKNAAGTLDDFRATETHRVSAADEFVDERLIDWALNHAGKKLADDERLADGSVNPVQRLRRGVITPSTFKPTLLKALTDFDREEKLQNLEASKASVRVAKSPVNSGRLECGLDLHVIDHAHQATFRVAEVSTG